VNGKGSVVRRRVLGRELRRLRERAGYTLETAAPLLEFSVSKLNRIEVGLQAGLLQTPDYSRAMFVDSAVRRTADQLADDIAVRTIRQRRLTSTTDPITLDAVINERTCCTARSAASTCCTSSCTG
jgi:hypothetical protein